MGVAPRYCEGEHRGQQQGGRVPRLLSETIPPWLTCRSPITGEAPSHYSLHEAQGKNKLREFRADCLNRSISNATTSAALNAKRLIVWYKSPNLFPRKLPGDMFGNCPVRSCVVIFSYGTGDHARADAVLFESCPGKVAPARGHRGKIYVFFAMEPPSQTNGLTKTHWGTVNGPRLANVSFALFQGTQSEESSRALLTGLGEK